jgi:hypothetical protein
LILSRCRIRSRTSQRGSPIFLRAVVWSSRPKSPGLIAVDATTRDCHQIDEKATIRAFGLAPAVVLCRAGTEAVVPRKRMRLVRVDIGDEPVHFGQLLIGIQSTPRRTEPLDRPRISRTSNVPLQVPVASQEPEAEDTG